MSLQLVGNLRVPRQRFSARAGPQPRSPARRGTFPSVASSGVTQHEPEHRGQAAASAQSCCATAPAATRRVEVVVLVVISILLFALSFRMFTGLFRRRTYCAAANGTASVRQPARTRDELDVRQLGDIRAGSRCPRITVGSPPKQDDGPSGGHGLQRGVGDPHYRRPVKGVPVGVERRPVHRLIAARHVQVVCPPPCPRHA